MKKLILFLLMGLMGLTGFSQRAKVITSTNFLEYKKHYSHSIEGGIENNQFRQFVAGNVTDWGFYNKKVTGHPFDGVSLLLGSRAYLIGVNDRAHLTDFTIYPADDYQYGAGTGIYYPDGSGYMGYPFFAIYDKVTMEIISAEYYNLVYPGVPEPVNAVGLRIKYSSAEQAFYISGVMADRVFEDINMSNIRGKSKGFILKIDETGLNGAQALIFEPDNLPNAPEVPLLCVVTDLEISADESKIAFTGITTKEQFSGYHHPMTGMIDMDLNLQWCYAYEFTEDRYSGVDVEYNTTDNKLLVLHNSARYPFAVMELDYNGNITQQAVKYEFTKPGTLLPGFARAHIMHYYNGGIMITGNCFVDGSGTGDQLLFSYEIADATNLQSGNNPYTYYSRERVPAGDQKPVTSYWAPENSIYQDDKLFITGIYNNNNTTFGYTLINVDDMPNIPGCINEGEVSVTGPITNDVLGCDGSIIQCNKTIFDVLNEENQPTPIIECIRSKSSPALGDGTGSIGSLWQFKGIDAQGIHAALVSENSNTVYQVNVYDVVGRKIYSSTYNVSEGQKEVYLEFATKAEMYIISVSNGSQSETLKVMGNR